MSVSKLVQIKVLHTLIWGFFVFMIFYTVYTGLFNKVNLLTWIAIGFVFLESLTLIIFKWYCPLTIVARKYSDSDRENFDIYLPNWIAKHNKTIFSIIFLFGLVLVLYRTFFQS
ncbi:MAG TPA: hypothetical protein DCG75_10630 [Bacteroidales bacterium]|nr:hypothetical protein [Bacteroidales bacterium]